MFRDFDYKAEAQAAIAERERRKEEDRVRSLREKLISELYELGLDDVDAINGCVKQLRAMKPSYIMELSPASQAVIVKRCGYDAILGDAGLEVWIPHVAENGRPGKWKSFAEWFPELQEQRNASAMEALQAVEILGLHGIGSSPGYFGPHLRYGLERGLFTQPQIGAAQRRHQRSSR